MKEYTLELPMENWSAVDACWKDEKRKYYQPPYQAAMKTDLRCFLIPEYGDEPYFTNSSNPTFKEVKEYAKSIVEFINDRNIDMDEIEISAEAGIYYREAGFMEYEPVGDHAYLLVATLKLKK
jgi:hypothetical protein